MQIQNSKLKIQKSLQQGQVILVLALFFVFVSTSVILGFSLAASKEFRNTSDLNKSLADYYAAESGIEDIAYRVITNKQIASPEELVLNSATTTTTVTDIGSDKEILAIGDLSDKFRSVRTRVTLSSVGVSFNYGMQVGDIGLSMSNSSGVNGNVYANGNISGSGTSNFITGTAVAASTGALAVDQSNDSPATPPNSVVFGNTGGTQDFAQSFTPGTTAILNRVELYLKKTLSPANITVRITTDNGGVPNTSSLATQTLSAALVTTSYGWVEVVFSSPATLTSGTTYWLVLDAGTNATNYYTVGANATYTGGTGKLGTYGSSWSDTTPSGLDGYFRTYMGNGVFSTIDNVNIGTAGIGDARADTVTNSDIQGALYCQSGSGNNKSCNTSLPNPSPQAFPISQAVIDQWKADAAEGGTQGDYIQTSGTQSLGSKHITGNFTLTNTAILNITGTIWVDGNISISNSARAQLSSSYGASSGVVVADGTISTSNSGGFFGSGTAGSYVIALTTSSSGSAVTLSNSAGSVIIYAPNGTATLSNTAGAKQLTAKGITMTNSATITYETGLASAEFTSGPGGSYEISSWREVE